MTCLCSSWIPYRLPYKLSFSSLTILVNSIWLPVHKHLPVVAVCHWRGDMQQFPLGSESKSSHLQINFVLRCPTSLNSKSYFESFIKNGLLKIQPCLPRPDYSVAHQQRLSSVLSFNVLLPALFDFCNPSFFLLVLSCLYFWILFIPRLFLHGWYKLYIVFQNFITKCIYTQFQSSHYLQNVILG